MRALVGIVILGLGLNSCFEMPVISKGKVSTLDEAPRLASTVSSAEGKSISAYDPNSKVATTIAAPTGNLAGSSVTMQAGALSIAAELVVEEAVPLSETSVTGSLAIRSDITIKPVGSGLIIRPTTDVDLTKPLTISMPINPSAGLNTWLSGLFASSNKYYTVFYKYFVNGELKAGAIATSDLRISADGSVNFEGYFGAYWLAEVSSPILEKIEVKTEEPIINKDKVSVISSTGVITEETIVAKAAIPTVDWKSISLSLSVEGSQRTVTAKASIGAGRTLSSCSVDLFEKTDANSGINIVTNSQLTASYVIVKQEAHTLYGRFRCSDDQQRLTLSGWSLAVTVPAAQVTSVVATASSDYCGSAPPELRFYVGGVSAATGTGTGTASAGGLNLANTQVTTSSPLANLKAFTSLGNCIYSLELDTLGDFAFGIQTADMKTSCTSAAATLGEYTLSCTPANGPPGGMKLTQGNYIFTLDFSSSATAPKMKIALQPCALDDLYLVRGDTSGNWSNPDSGNRMTHLGGCQYTADMSRGAYGSARIRIQNLNGTYACGDQSPLQSNMSHALSCNASGSFYTLYISGSNIISYRFLVNLGNNLDRYGQPTTLPYVSVSEVDTCMANLYMLGTTTAAGSNRIAGVNSFRKGSYCSFNFSWVNNGPNLTPFYIGIGEGPQKCGMPAGTTPAGGTTLDCTASAVPIDLQSSVTADAVHQLTLTTDSTTGLPSYTSIAMINAICGDSYYAVRNGTIGFSPAVDKVMTEVKECIYQFDWTPTAADHNLMFLRGTTPAVRCGRYAATMNPTVSGPAVDVSCFMDNQLAVDFPLVPTGVSYGTKYKVTLDMRLDPVGSAKVSLAPAPAMSCPDLHVIGLNNLSPTPDAGNKMLQTGDCNYLFNFRTPPAGIATNFRIRDSASTFNCGRDIYYPDVNGRTASMECSGSPSDLFANLYANTNYQIQVHYESGGTSTVSVTEGSNICQPSTLDGPAAPYQNSSYSSSFKAVDSCVEELLWVPTQSTSAFRVKNQFATFASYCGLDQSQSQLSLAAAPRLAVCNIFNASNANNFSVTEGVSAGQKYVIRLDRKNQLMQRPKISVTAVHTAYPPTQAGIIGGTTAINMANSTSFPGARESAGVWTSSITGMKYMFGGTGIDENGNWNYLADLWGFDGTNWYLLPSISFGVPNGYNYAAGVAHPSNRPSARARPVTLFDPTNQGKLWMFGGMGLDSAGNVGYLNDLWVLDLSTGSWTLMSGSTVRNAGGARGAVGAASHAYAPGGREGASGFMDGGGKIHIFGGFGYPDVTASSAGVVGYLNDVWTFDPSSGYASNSWAFVGGETEINAAGTAALPSSRRDAFSWKDNSGTFWIFGGMGVSANTAQGPNYGMLSDLWAYDAVNHVWSRRGGPNYNEAVGISGLRNVSNPRIWPPARSSGSSWVGSDGKLWLFAGVGQTGPYTYPGLLSDVWNYDPINQEWTWLPTHTQTAMGADYAATYQAADLGAMGSMNTGYRPGSRLGAIAWPDNMGNVLIFGGNGYSGSGSQGVLNDLWYLDF